MFGDLDWPLNASRGFVNISEASYYSVWNTYKMALHLPSNDTLDKTSMCNWLEALQLNKSQISSIDFVINRFFMKMFNTNDIEIVQYCQQEFCFSLPSVTLARRTENF